MKRTTGWAALALATALAVGCSGDGDEMSPDDGSGTASGSASGSASAPEETTTTTEELEVDESVDRSQRREAEDATALVSIDGEETEVTGVVCRAFGPGNLNRWIVEGGEPILVFLEGQSEEPVELGEPTELDASRVSRLLLEDGERHEIAAESVFTEDTGSITVTVTDLGDRATVLVEGETDAGTELVLDVDCPDFEAQDMDGNPIEG